MAPCLSFGRTLLRAHSVAVLAFQQFHHQRFSTASTPALKMDYKRAKLDDTISGKVIGTHSGSFQADEAMGVWMLRQIPEYRNSKVVRSRDLKVLEPLDIVIDVGGVYDHNKKRYDHHQRGYSEFFDSGKEGKDGRCTKLSASGLVYRHYGKEVISVSNAVYHSQERDVIFTKSRFLIMPLGLLPELVRTESSIGIQENV